LRRRFPGLTQGRIEKLLRKGEIRVDGKRADGKTRVAVGQTLRLPIPDMTEERRKEMVKLAGTYAEKAKIAARNVRRDGMEALKAAEKKGKISQDEQKRLEADVQKITDKAMTDIDTTVAAKEKEILGK
jgi:ribosome recycling factor